HVDVAIPPLTPGGEGHPVAIWVPPGGIDLRDTPERLAFRHAARVQLQERQSRLCSIVAAEHHRSSIHRDVGFTGTNTECQLFGDQWVAAVEAMEIAPAIAKVVNTREIEDQVRGGANEAHRGLALHVEHMLDIHVV